MSRRPILELMMYVVERKPIRRFMARLIQKYLELIEEASNKM